VAALAEGGGGALALALGVIGGLALRDRGAPASYPAAGVPREQWTMPPVTLLTRPRLSGARRAALFTLGGYMVVALVMLLVKSIQLAGG
jgi:hypothetical protein